MPYRTDIDGLRGIAVIAVVLFHLGVPGFTGGFAGVDVFFVISGFLITSLIHPDIAAGRFSFAAFYERRIRRLLPALLTVTALSLLAGVLLLERHDLRYLHQSVIATTLFSANFLFWKTTGYFDSAADTRPLLHAWSLSVEEQFYIVFPVLLLLAVRYLPRQAYWLVLAAAAASFTASALLTAGAPTAAYYLPVFRTWELLMGALLALRPLPAPLSALQRNALAFIGVILLGYSLFAFTRETSFPGASALVPCAGTVLLIIAGMNGGSGVSRLLSLRPLAFIGLISYSLYLWHWPLLVYAKYLAIRELTALETAALLVVSLLAAAASWRYIERPFRGARGLLSRTALFRAAAMASLLLIAAAVAGYRGSGIDLARQREAGSARVLQHQHCMNREASRMLDGDFCVLGAEDGTRPSFLLWGDSHAGALAPAIEGLARRKGRAGLLIGQAGCLPLLDVERHDRRDLPCREFTEAAARILEQNPEIRTVLLVARWAAYAGGARLEDPSGTAARIAREGPGDNARVLREGLERTLRFLAQQNREVVLVTEAPDVGWDVPTAMARSLAFGRSMPESPSLETHRARQKGIMDMLQDVSRRHSLRVVDLSPTLCPRGACLIERSGRSLYLDSNHLSTHGSAFVAPALADAL